MSHKDSLSNFFFFFLVEEYGNRTLVLLITHKDLNLLLNLLNYYYFLFFLFFCVDVFDNVAILSARELFFH